MLHAPAKQMFGKPVPQRIEPVCPSLHAPLTPAAYLRLRRKSSGQSVTDAAAKIAPKAADQAEVRALIEMLETDGVHARHVSSLDLLASAYALDSSVYFQLMTEPADRHPMVCRGCGCSKWDPCHHDEHEELDACTWAAENICSRCTSGDML